MSNYALDTPIKRTVFVPDNDIPFAPATEPVLPAETDQSHRRFTWLYHRPQTVSATSIPTESGRKKSKH